MKVTIIILAMLLLSSCATVDERIKDYSYTTKRYIENDINYQVYQTKSGRLYIIKLNRRETKFKRAYLK
jgi:starvation-inducible outer membrane lipoprotein